MKRPGFLPLFFVVLGVVFAALVFIRIRSYRALDGARPRVDTLEQTQEIATLEGTNTETIVEAVPADYGSVPLLESQPADSAYLFAQPNATAPARLRSPASAAPQAAPAAPTPAAKAAPPPVIASTQSTSRAPARDSAASRSSRPRETTQQASNQPVDSASDDDRNDQKKPAADPNDPTSDSKAPQLATIGFLPAEIADGEETTLIIQATDDLSGIRSISGTIMGPSGAVQGFACQRDADTNRYIARIIVPKDAAEGMWNVNYVNLMDNASNATALTAARGGLPPSAAFRVVSSRPDSQGPSLQSIWLDRRSMRGGEKNLVFVRAQDDNSGVNLISGIFQSPSRQARVGFVCRTATGDVTWTCELAAPACADCGEWQLEQLQMQDKANNMTTLRAAQSELIAAVRVDISSELCDATPPAIQAVALDRPAVSNVEQSTITITATLGDDACGVMSVSGQATGPQTSGVPPRLYFSFTQGSDPQIWTGKIIVPRLASKGIWKVSFLQVLDRGQNLKTYTTNDPLLAGIAFVVD
jgi:hypothetical protein